MKPLICGVDEAGRGPLAGPVYAAAVILNPQQAIFGLADSKKLSEKKRDALSIEIKQKALVWAIAQSSVEEIDTLNILQASLLAMKRAIENAYQKLNQLTIVNRSNTLLPNEIFNQILVQVDGNQRPHIDLAFDKICGCEAIVQGDSKIDAISAASILAKVARDAELYKLDQQYPQYRFAQHKGYPTSLHLEMLSLHGVSPIHRLSFAPVRKLTQPNL